MALGLGEKRRAWRSGGAQAPGLAVGLSWSPCAAAPSRWSDLAARSHPAGTSVSSQAGWGQETNQTSECNGQSEPQCHPKDATVT